MENVFWLKEPTRTPQRDERHRLVSAKWVMGLIAPSAVREARWRARLARRAHSKPRSRSFLLLISSSSDLLPYPVLISSSASDFPSNTIDYE